MPFLDVCFTPELLPLFDLKGKAAVVVDVLRATSSMVTAFAHGVQEIVPVSTLEECKALKKKGYLTAAERDGLKAEGFDLGNSPFSFMTEVMAGQKLAITTTNGTHAIRLSLGADGVVVGAFLNITAMANYLKQLEKDVVVVCAGWKGAFNLEDTLFAGALMEELQDTFQAESDAALAAWRLHESAKGDMLHYLSLSSHVRRLAKIQIIKDVEFCLQEDLYQVLPVWQEGRLVSLQPEEVDLLAERAE
ncbi:2-phosphosulfolactate phosphatase family protein [soil metagenome]